MHYSLKSRFTWSSVTKTLHGTVRDFHDVISLYPNSFKIDRSKGSQKMKFFTIMNKRAHAFVCETCRFIKIATVQNTALRNPDDYKIRHECDEDASMHTASDTSGNNSMRSAQGTSSNNSMQSVSETSDNDSMPSTSMSSTDGLETISQHSNNSVMSNSEVGSSLNSNPDSYVSDSISIDDSMASHSSYESSGANDSGFRTPDFLDDSSQNPPISDLFRCKNRFAQLSGSLNMELVIKCQFATTVVSEIVDHKAICPLRYKSKMAQSNPGYLSKILWSFAKELPVADYLGK